MATSRYDRSIEASSLPTYNNIGVFTDPKLFRCIVIRKYSPEDAKSTEKQVLNKQVLYDVVILGGVRNGQLISNVRCSYTLGGKNNRTETVLQPCTKWESIREKPEQGDGDIVYVLFNQGDTSIPVIIAYDKNLQNSYTFEDYLGTGSSEQIQGIETNHSSEGEFSHIVKGGTKNPTTGEFEPEAQEKDYWHIFRSIKGLIEFKNNIQTMFRADWEGNVELSTLAGAKYKIQNSNKIAMGAQGIELLQQISKQLAALITCFNGVKNHTHPIDPITVKLGTAVVGATLASNTNSSLDSTKWDDAATTLTDIQKLIDQIKGTL